jgi:hypothetical protein
MLLLSACISCTSQAEQQRRHEAAMIEQAKLDAASEEEFVKDSLTLAASISTDTIAELLAIPSNGIDENGNAFTYKTHSAVSRSGARCLLQLPRFNELIVGDTLACQWEPRK